MPKSSRKNIIGPQVRRFRADARLSQAKFAERCQRGKWDISRGIVAAIEGQVRCVTGEEFVKLAQILQVPLEALLPEAMRRRLPNQRKLH